MTQRSIVIIDYGVGNTQSVANAIAALGYRYLKISRLKQDLLSADALILPGVGAFNVCMENIRNQQLIDVLNESVLLKKTPILGICVGMQIMATESEENGLHLGLNWIPGRVVKLELPERCAVPHVGWNELTQLGESILTKNAPIRPNFYFDHSFHYVCDLKYVSAQCNYGIPITAIINKENIYGVQFHPEKSQRNGLKLLRAFFNEVEKC